MEQQRISWGEVRERAHALRLKSLKAGEPGLSVRVSDLLETLPLPYDPEPLPDDATQEEILEYAKWLGMDLEEDKDLFWIARGGLKAPLPENWKPCKTAEDEVMPFALPASSLFPPPSHPVP